MKFLNFMGLVVLGTIVCGAAHARRTISYDCGAYQTTLAQSPFQVGTNVPTTVLPINVANSSLDVGNYSLTIGPGAGFGAGFCEVDNSPDGIAVASQWMLQGGATKSPNTGFNALWEVLVTDDPGKFTVDFMYDSTITNKGVDPGCAGDTAMLSVNSAKYSLKGACGGAGDYSFTFNGSTGKLIGSAWSTVAATPEIDSKSALSGLTLLLGLIAMTRARRGLDGKPL
jgi:hypothetical protein